METPSNSPLSIHQNNKGGFVCERGLSLNQKHLQHNEWIHAGFFFFWCGIKIFSLVILVSQINVRLVVFSVSEAMFLPTRLICVIYKCNALLVSATGPFGENIN